MVYPRLLRILLLVLTVPVAAEQVFVSEWTSTGVSLLRRGNQLLFVPFTAGVVVQQTVSFTAYRYDESKGANVDVSPPEHNRSGLAFSIGDTRFRWRVPVGKGPGVRPYNTVWAADTGTFVDLQTSPPLQQVSAYVSESPRSLVLTTPSPPFPHFLPEWSTSESLTISERLEPLRAKYPHLEIQVQGHMQEVAIWDKTTKAPGATRSAVAPQPTPDEVICVLGSDYQITGILHRPGGSSSYGFMIVER